jgi:hypothetical protein
MLTSRSDDMLLYFRIHISYGSDLVYTVVYISCAPIITRSGRLLERDSTDRATTSHKAFMVATTSVPDSSPLHACIDEYSVLR